VRDEYEVMKVKVKPVPASAYSYQKEASGLPGLTSPCEGRIAISSTYAFTKDALRRDLGFNESLFGI
jgi:hypothetical protein